MEELEIELKDLENAQNDIVSAINDLKDVDGLDEEYKELDLILQRIEDKMLDIRIELKNLEDEAMYKENEEQWKAEQKEQYYEYRREAL